jgi:hypothetical protein
VTCSERQAAKDLLHYSIEWLSENIAGTNKPLIIELAWYLIEIDSDDPLLAHLTGVSSSMVDSGSSMIPSVHKFDLLLLFSRCPANTFTTTTTEYVSHSGICLESLLDNSC